MKILFLFLFVLLFSSCTEEVGKSAAVLMKLQFEFVEEVQNVKNLSVGMLGYAAPDEVDTISVGFALNKYVSTHEARKEIVWLAEKLVNMMNNSKELRPYLKKYPVDVNNVFIVLEFKCDDRNPNCISWVSTLGENLDYHNSRGRLLEEKFNDAQAIVHGSLGNKR